MRPDDPTTDPMQAAAKATGDVFFVVRAVPDPAFEYISDQIETLLAVTADQCREGVACPTARQLADVPAVRDFVDGTLDLRHADGYDVTVQVRGRRRLRADGSTVLEGSLRRVEGHAAADSELHYYRMLTQNMKDVVWVLDAETLRFLYVSPSVQALRGYTPEEVLAQSLDSALPADAAESVRRSNARLLEQLQAGEIGSEDFFTEEIPQLRKDGSVVWTEVITNLHRNARTGRVEVWGVSRDITERRRISDELLMLAENASDVVLRLDTNGALLWVSPSVRTVLGWEPEQLIGTSVAGLMHPEDLRRLNESRPAIMASGAETARAEARYATADGRWIWMSLATRLLRDADGELVGVIDALRDVQSEVEARQALAESEERFRLAMAEAPQGMALLDLDGRFLEANPALCRMLGRTVDEVLGRTLTTWVHPEDAAGEAAVRRGLLDGAEEYVRWEGRLTPHASEVRWVQSAAGLLRSADGEPRSFVVQIQDITDNRRAMELLAYQATHDRLTGLLTREELTDRLTRALRYRPRTGTRTAVMFCDVDNLKGVNDTLGHAAGDALIVAASQAVAESVRREDVVGRIGGDEFVVVLTGLHSVADAERLAAKVRAAVAEPIDFEGTVLRPSMSIGIAMAEAGQSAESVLRNADLALYAAKDAGRDTVRAFPPNSG